MKTQLIYSAPVIVFSKLKRLRKAGISSLPGIGLLSVLIFQINILHGDVPYWRHQRNGTFDVSSAPTNWQSEERFRVVLPSMSNASPILIDDRLVVTAEPDLLICMDSQTGEVLWERSNDLYTLRNVSAARKAELESYRSDIEIQTESLRRLRRDVRRLESAIEANPDNQQAKVSISAKKQEMSVIEARIQSMEGAPFFRDFALPPTQQANGYSSYTPCFDGERIYVQFGFGVVVSYDLEGNRLWFSVLEHPDHIWGGSTMPQVVGGKLVVRFDNYCALDTSTGDVLWRTPSEVVFGSPVPFEIEDEPFLFTPRGEVLRVRDGQLMDEGLVVIHKERDYAIFNTPTLKGDVLYAANGVGRTDGHAYAFKIPTSLEALEKDGLEPLWYTEVPVSRYFSSPLVCDGLVYIVNEDNVVTALQADSGEIVYTHEIHGLNSTAYSSLTIAAGNIYHGTEDGHLVIFKPGASFEEIARQKMEAFRSTPIFNGGMGYLRTHDSLIAAGAR